MAVSVIVLYPVLMLLYGSVRSSAPGDPGFFTIQNYVRAYSDPETYTLFITTFLIVGTQTVLSAVVAIFFAWVVTRTDTPWRGLITIFMIIPFFIPSILEVFAWALLLSPRTGLLNLFFIWLFGLEEPPFNIYTLGGLIWTWTLTSGPTKFLLIVAAFRAMDSSLEEAALASGASPIGVFFRITLPLMAPTVLGASLLTFVRGMESFELPVILGLPAGIFVFTNKIYETLEFGYPPQYGLATALAVTLFLMTAALVFVQGKLLSGKSFVVISGKGYRPMIVSLGPWKYVTLGICAVYFLIATVLPLSQLILGSFLRVFGLYEWQALTLEHYRTVFQDALVWRSMKNSFLLGGLAAFLTMILSFGVAYVVAKTDFAGRKVLDLISWIPWTIPGLVLGLGMLWAYIRLPYPIEIYGTLGILFVAFVTNGLPLGVRLASGGLSQIGNELEESAWVHGASWLQAFRTITLKLMVPVFAAGMLVLFVGFVRSLGPVILLYGHGTELLSVTIFHYWQQGEPGTVCALSLLLLVIILVPLVAARALGAARADRL
ncbi:MAG: ABC transporter permease [Candidatus Binatia bacterium]